MGSARTLGTRGAEFTSYGATDVAFTARLADLLADHDDAVLAAYVDDETTVSYRQLRDELAAQTETGAGASGVLRLGDHGRGRRCAALAGIAELLPAAEGDVDGPVVGHGVQGRTRSGRGEDRVRAHVLGDGAAREIGCKSGGDDERKVTAISVFDRGSAVQHPAVAAGQIGKLWGLGDVQIGDAIGSDRERRPRVTTSRRRHWRRSSSRAAPPTEGRSASRSPSSPSRTR